MILISIAHNVLLLNERWRIGRADLLAKVSSLHTLGCLWQCHVQRSVLYTASDGASDSVTFKGQFSVPPQNVPMRVSRWHCQRDNFLFLFANKRKKKCHLQRLVLCAILGETYDKVKLKVQVAALLASLLWGWRLADPLVASSANSVFLHSYIQEVQVLENTGTY